MFYGEYLEFVARNLGAWQLLMLRGKWQTEALLVGGTGLLQHENRSLICTANQAAPNLVRNSKEASSAGQRLFTLLLRSVFG